MKKKILEGLKFERKLAWDIFSEKEKEKAFRFSEGYKDFLNAKTEREIVKEGIKKAKENGFILLNNQGRKVYLSNRKKNLALSVLGKRPISEGANIVVAHLDSPRLDLKPQPLYEEEKLAFFKTHYYGGIKKYQWVTIPLALYGVIILKSGKSVEFVLGEDEPVFTITDLLPHLAKDQLKKKLEEGVEGEALNLLVGSLPVEDKKEKERIKLNILQELFKRFKIKEEDLVSSEIEIVPAGRARDLGFDRSLILGYGQDDRSCCYAGLQAIFNLEKPEKTSILLLVDKEEIGSEGTTGIQSTFLEQFCARLFSIKKEKVSQEIVRNFFSSSLTISGDVNAGLDPTYKEVSELRNSPRMGCGVVLSKFGGHGGKFSSSEASAEFIAYLRRIFEKDKVLWQTGEIGKIDKGGGGTVARYLARHNMEVVDIGPPLLSMHAPFEVSHKADIYSTYQAYLSFYGALNGKDIC